MTARISWNKGYTKDTHPGVFKISQTFKRKKINNFKSWNNRPGFREYLNELHKPFSKNQEHAFMVGLVLGDGHISEFPRSERIEITLNSKYPALVEYTRKVLLGLFKKEPTVHKNKSDNGVKLWVYQQKISQRLKVPTGSRKEVAILTPDWINQSDKFKIAFLKGLFEAEGSLSVHLPTYTHNLQFSNNNPSLLKIVKNLLLDFGFHPEVRENAIRLRRIKEIEDFRNLIAFRLYY